MMQSAGGVDAADRPVAVATAATWIGFAAMGIGMFMAILDIQVVVTSLPTIQAALGIDPDQMSWIQTAYLTAEVIAIPLTGLLTRALGMRRLFALAVSLFTLASIGCAASQSFEALVAWRIVQGFSGGTLIPAVFSAVFVLFPPDRQAFATTLAGVLAVLAPTVGPIVGGWITQTFSWHWLFLINVLPGIASAIAVSCFLPRQSARLSLVRQLDWLSLVLLAVALASLQFALKDAPEDGWTSLPILALLGLTAVALAAFVRRTVSNPHPIVDLGNFADRSFTVGCVLSFILGIGLFGSVYLLPVFLAFVRGHTSLEIGQVMLVSGVTQLLVAPIAVALESRVDARLLTGFGFLLFAIGQALSCTQTPVTGFEGMILPQVLRGAAVMFCLLPPTRLALGQLPPERVPDASGVFNLMRNLGGAIGIALIDTVIYQRAPHLAQAYWAALGQGNKATAAAIGVRPELLASHLARPDDAFTTGMLQLLVKDAALTQSINEAWMMVAMLTAAALLVVPLAKRAPAMIPGAGL